VAARLGVVGDSWLAFVKVGGGWVSTQATVANVTTGTTVSANATDGGWLVGGGVEYAFTAHWTGKFEYDFLGLSNQTLSSFAAGDRFSLDHNLQTFKVGFNYKF